MEDRRLLVPGDIYKHFKNKLYQIVGVAAHSETKEKFVVYQALYGEFGMYIRPYDMFMSEVDRVKYPEVTQKYRFERVNPQDIVSQDISEELTAKETKAFNDESVDNTASEDKAQEEALSGVNPYLMEFLDMNTSAEKIEYLASIKSKIDDRLISDIAASMDITVSEGDLDIRYASLISCLKTMARFECGRLR